jgi:hypothetical protein
VQGPQLDLGKTLGLYDTASVREKVRKWHTTGGGIVTPNDAIPAESDNDDKEVKSDKSAVSIKSGSRIQSKVSSASKLEIVDPPRIEKSDSPATSKVESAQDEVVVIFEEDKQSSVPPAAPPASPSPRIVERKPKAVSKLDAELREAIAPKKRVVSDGHWRRKRSPPKVGAPPSPPKPKPKPKPDVGLAWVRPPLLPRKPDEPAPPPKPKPVPKPIQVYSGRPRAKSAGILRSDEDSTLDRSDDEAIRVRMPTTPRPRPYPRVSRAIVEEQTPKSYKSNEEMPPERSSTARRKPSYGRAAEDSCSSAEDRRRRKSSYAKRRPSSSDDNPAYRTSRQSSSPEDRRDNYKSDRRPSRRKSPRSSLSDEESKEFGRSGKRGKSVDAKNPESEDEPESPPRKLANNDDDAAQRRKMFLQEHAQFKPKETQSADRKRNRLRKKSYSPEPVLPLVVLPAGPEAPARVPSNSVEAWLTTTPDPFVESVGEAKKSKRVFSFEPHAKDAITEVSTIDTESSILSELSEPRARRNSVKSSGKRHVSSSKRTTDHNVRAHSEPSDYLDPDDRTECSSTTSVSTLRRQGARRASQSPTKGRMKSPSAAKSYTESDVVSSAMTSSVDPAAFEPQEMMAKRMFPSTGKRLSTIASVETFKSKAQPAPPSAYSELSDLTAQAPDDAVTALPDLFDPSVVSASRSRASLKRKLTTHADLISVLSMPASRSKSIVSARSIRTHRSRLETATLEDLMKELASDETKYMRELRTLADGVIPILLKCVLSKSDAAIAAGLFKRAPSSEKEAIAEASKAIHDMSVAIQRLKGVHTSIPKDDHFKFLIWAQRALSIYEGYVKTWRLGFQDVVVSLAVEEEESTISSSKSAESGAWDQGLPRNEDGYIVDGDGERVDVAFLLKRPLVRLKFLAKTLKASEP